MKLHVGTSGYAYKPWKGRFYPKGLPDAQMLRYYGEHFPAVEINNSFRRMPTPSAMRAWMADVPKHFQFAIKSPQQITHMRRLANVAAPVRQLFTAMAVLQKQMGPVLFQLPPNFKKDLPRLQAFLKLLPPVRRVTFEFRHQSWFDDEVFDLLRKHRAALCIADADSELKVPFVATAKWGYLRLRRSRYSTAQLRSWAKQVQKQKWTDAFVFFKHEDKANGPRYAKQFIQLADG